MSHYEGKNIFRTVLSQRPIYSGSSNFVASRIDVSNIVAPSSNSSSLSSQSHVVDLTTHAFNATLNIVNRSTGQTILSRDLGLEDDVILNIDAIPVKQQQQQQTLTQDGEQQQQTQQQQPLLYIAASTRSLQIYVFALYAVTLAEARKKLRRNARKKNPLADSSAVDEAFIRTKLVEDDPLGLTYALSLVKNWTADQSAISCLKFSPRTYHLASGSADGGLKVWSVLNHYLTHSFRGQNSGVVTSLAFLDDGKEGETESLLAAGTFEGYITVIDFSSKKVIASGQPHTSSVEALSLTTRSESDKGAVLLISAARDRNVTVFEARSLKVLRTVALGHPLLACSFASPFVGFYGCENGLLGAFCVSPETFGVVVFAVRDAPKHGVEEEHSVRAISFLENNDKHNNNSTSDIRHSLLPQTVLVVDASYRLFTFVAENPSGKTCTLNAPTGANLTNKRTDILNFDQIMDVKFFPTSSVVPVSAEQRARRNELVIATNARDAYVTRSIGSSQLRGTLQGHSDIVVALDVSADGSQIITASKDMTARVWDSDTLKCIAVTQNTASASTTTTKQQQQSSQQNKQIHSAELTSVKFIPTSNAVEVSLVCTVSFDSVISCWDLSAISKNMNADHGVIAQLPSTSSVASCHDGPTFCLAASPNGQYLCTGGKDKKVNLWSMKGKRVVKEGSLSGHRRTVAAVAFSPIDKLVVSGSNDGSMRVWSLVSLTCVRTLQIDQVPLLQISFFNKGTQVISMNAEGVSRFWAVSAGECVAVTNPHNERSWALALREEEVSMENLKQRKEDEEAIGMMFDENDRPIDDDVAVQKQQQQKQKKQQGGENDIEAGDEEQLDDDENDEEDDEAFTGKTYLRTILVSGGADGTLVCQEDFTDQRVEELRIEREQTTVKEQQLRNNIREGDFKQAFKIALSLNHPRHLRQVIISWMARTNSAAALKQNQQQDNNKESGQRRGRQDGDDDNSDDAQFYRQLIGGDDDDVNNIEDDDVDECLTEVADIISTLSHNELHRLFGFTRVWLTNAKHSGAASLVVASTLKALHPQKLEKLGSFSEVAEALRSYSKRHLSRLRRTQDHLFYLEFLTKGQTTGADLKKQ